MANTLDGSEEWLPHAEAMERLGVKRWWVWKRLKAGVLVGRKDHRGRLYIQKESVDALLENLPDWSEAS